MHASVRVNITQNCCVVPTPQAPRCLHVTHGTTPPRSDREGPQAEAQAGQRAWRPALPLVRRTRHELRDLRPSRRRDPPSGMAHRSRTRATDRKTEARSPAPHSPNFAAMSRLRRDKPGSVSPLQQSAHRPPNVLPSVREPPLQRRSRGPRPRNPSSRQCLATRCPSVTETERQRAMSSA
jgi:hypothetical protein